MLLIIIIMITIYDLDSIAFHMSSSLVKALGRCKSGNAPVCRNPFNFLKIDIEKWFLIRDLKGFIIKRIFKSTSHGLQISKLLS